MSLVTMNQQSVIVLPCKWSVRSCYIYYGNFPRLRGSNSKEKERMSVNASERIQRCSVFEGEGSRIYMVVVTKIASDLVEMMGIGKFYLR